MRAFTFAAAASLAISACNGSDTAENTVNVGDNVAAEDIVANDTTAIDAATNEAANMAEESDVTLEPISGDSSDSSGSSDSPAPRRSTARTDRDSDDSAPAANSTVANTVTNAE